MHAKYASHKNYKFVVIPCGEWRDAKFENKDNALFYTHTHTFICVFITLRSVILRGVCMLERVLLEINVCRKDPPPVPSKTKNYNVHTIRLPLNPTVEYEQRLLYQNFLSVSFFLIFNEYYYPILYVLRASDKSCWLCLDVTWIILYLHTGTIGPRSGVTVTITVLHIYSEICFGSVTCVKKCLKFFRTLNKL